jgi:hypothetical protein
MTSAPRSPFDRKKLCLAREMKLRPLTEDRFDLREVRDERRKLNFSPAPPDEEDRFDLTEFLDARSMIG